MAGTTHSHDGNRVLLPLSGGLVSRAITSGARLIGAGLLVAIGLIHLILAPQYMQQAAYVGIGFYVTCVAAWLTAAAIVVGVRYAWILGGLIAAGALGGLVLSITVGLPNFQDSLAAPWATLSLLLESLFVAVYVVLAVVRRNPVLVPSE